MVDQQSKEAPLAVRAAFKSLVTSGLSSQEVLDYFHAEQVNAHRASHLDNTPQTRQDKEHKSAARPSQSASRGKFGCPWCKKHIKLPKDFIRHVEQKCAAKAEFRCPNCSKKFTRKSRFKNHHRGKHPQHCGPDPVPCTHVERARVQFEARKLLRCGFCTEHFDSDLRGFLRHLISHYKQGAVLEEWQDDLTVPKSVTSSTLPQVDLSIRTGNGYDQSDFSAFCSGFNVPMGGENLQLTSSAAVAPSIHEGPLNDTLAPLQTVQDLESYECYPTTNLFSSRSNPGLIDGTNWNANFDTNQRLGPLETSGNYFGNSPERTVPTGQSQIFTNAVYQQPSPDFNQFSTVFNATPPLPPVSGKRRSFPNCLLGAFHSLDNFLPN